MTNFQHKLPNPVKLVSDRKQYTVNFCKGKRVLHLGCVDTGRREQTEETLKSPGFLHTRIADVATELIGVDVDVLGVEWLEKAGYDVQLIDIEHHDYHLRQLFERVDVIVMPEILEHLRFPYQALRNLSKFNGDILISTLNAFSARHAMSAGQGVELVHEDHNCWFSPTTLKTLLSKSGLDIKELLLYYWEQQGTGGLELTKLLTSKPYLAEGIIAIAHSTEA